MINLEDRVILKKPDINDIEALFIIKNDIESNSKLGGFNTGYSKKDIHEWIQFHNSSNKEVLYIIQRIDNDKLIGHVGLYNIDFRIRKAEFAILIADKESRGKGFGKLCTEFMLDYAFNQLNLNRIELSLLADNEEAMSLYLKNGFVQEGLQKQAQFKNGHYIDVVLMAKFRSK